MTTTPKFLVTPHNDITDKTYFNTFKSAVDYANNKFNTSGATSIYKYDSSENGYVIHHSICFRTVEFVNDTMVYSN